jgi:hypothetical protein
MTQFTNPTLKPAGSTTIGVKVDRLLDHISYLENRITRTSDFLMKLMQIHPDLQFDISEAILILNETRIDSDARRFPEDQDPVLVLTGTETKEDQQ